MKRILIVLLCMSFNAQAHVGNYLMSALNQYRATRACARNDFNAAQQLLERGLVDYPHDDKLNYNLGCVYHGQKKVEQAEACFKRATASTDVKLKELAYFNLANSYVALEKLDDAIAAYEQVLALNAHNEQAKHNLEMIKKKKQEQEQQKDKPDKNPKDKNPEDKNKDKQEQKDKEQESDQSQNSDQQQNNKSDNDNSGDKNEQQKDNQQNSQQPPQQSSDQQQQQNGSQDDKNKKSNNPIDRGSQSERSGDWDNLHDEAVNAKYDKQAGNEKLDKHLQLVLMQAEKNDEEQYKKMIKAHVKQEMPAQSGQKNW